MKLKTIADIQDAICDAMQSDLEHGVRWINEEETKIFYAKHPRLGKVLGAIADIEE